MGAFYIGEKVAVRGLGSKVCAGCKAGVKITHHLFSDFPCIDILCNNICNWISKVWSVQNSSLWLIMANWGKQIEALESILTLLCFCYLKFTWHLRIAKLFQKVVIHACFSNLLLSDLQVQLGHSREWVQVQWFLMYNNCYLDLCSWGGCCGWAIWSLPSDVVDGLQ